METWVWIVVAIVVIAIVVVAVMFSRRRKEHQLVQRQEKAQELRTRGQEADLRAKEQAAEAAQQQADAQRARMEAERLEREANDRAQQAERARQAAESHLADASRLDPGNRDVAGRPADVRATDTDSGARRAADPTPGDQVADDRDLRNRGVDDPATRRDDVRGPGA